MWCVRTMEHYSVFKKKEIETFVTTCMKLEDIMLSEINQTEKDEYCLVSLICGIWKKMSNLETESWMVVASDGAGWGGIGERLVKGGYKLSVMRLISSGDLVYSMLTIANDTDQNSKRVNLKHSHWKKSKCQVMNVLFNLFVGILSQCMHIANHYSVHFKYLTILLVNYKSWGNIYNFSFVLSVLERYVKIFYSGCRFANFS